MAEKSATRRSNTALRVWKHFPNDPVARKRGTGGSRSSLAEHLSVVSALRGKKAAKGRTRTEESPQFSWSFFGGRGGPGGSAFAKLERNSIVRARGLEAIRRDFFTSRRTERDGGTPAGRRSSVSAPLFAPSFSPAPPRRPEFPQFPRSPRELRSSEPHAPLCPAISSQRAENAAPLLANEIIVDRRGSLGAEEYIRRG